MNLPNLSSIHLRVEGASASLIDPELGDGSRLKACARYDIVANASPIIEHSSSTAFDSSGSLMKEKLHPSSRYLGGSASRDGLHR